MRSPPPLLSAPMASRTTWRAPLPATSRTRRLEARGASASAERLPQLPDQILRILHPHRQADQPVTDAERGAYRGGQRGVRHEPRMLDQALHPAQALREREEVTPLEHPAGIVERSLQYRGHDPSVATRHLSACQRMLWMARQARIVHALHLRVAGEELRDRESVGAVPLHPQRERLDAA